MGRAGRRALLALGTLALAVLVYASAGGGTAIFSPAWRSPPVVPEGAGGRPVPVDAPDPSAGNRLLDNVLDPPHWLAPLLLGALVVLGAALVALALSLIHISEP